MGRQADNSKASNTRKQPPPLWEEFVQKHVDWVSRLPKADASYMLPEEAVDELTSQNRGHGTSQALLSDADGRAELAFRELCCRYGKYTIGVFDGQPVSGLLLADTWRLNEGQCALDDEVKPRRGEDHSHDQQRVYAAALHFHKPYVQELKELKQRWASLPTPKPRYDPWVDARWIPKKLITQPIKDYLEHRDVFCARWHLQGFYSWDLPQPRPAMEAISLEKLMAMSHRSLIVDYYPPYADTPSCPVEEKQAFAMALPNNPLGSLAHLPSMPPILRKTRNTQHAHIRAFEMWLFESTVIRRYGKQRGLTSALLRGFSKTLGMSFERLRRLRRIYIPFLPD